MLTHKAPKAIPIIPLHASAFAGWISKQKPAWRNWAKATQYEALPATSLILTDENGNPACVVAGGEAEPGIWSIAHLPTQLPPGNYRLEAKWKPHQLAEAALGFELAQYQFNRYRKAKAKPFTLQLPATIPLAPILAKRDAIFLVRDLINTPANDMGPQDLSNAAKAIAKETGTTFSEIVGDALLKKNYPAIHVVGRAAAQPPRLITLEYGKTSDPLVVLIGKGVTFDTGGLDIKPYNSMKLMKKDMGGAALVLGLMQLIISAKLPIRVKALIPAVENSIAGNAFRPQDIIASRKGLTIEIGSTDAEGRLILADALTAADEANPDLIVDVATLTGAARTALGTELPALYCNREKVAADLLKSATQMNDPLWQLPLWQGYARYVNSSIADVTNTPNYGFAGSITAALFLERFISPATPWVHIDTYAWNAEGMPGRPVGGEALTLRAIFHYLQTTYK